MTLPLLAELDLTGAVITADALHTQRKPARWLRGRVAATTGLEILTRCHRPAGGRSKDRCGRRRRCGRQPQPGPRSSETSFFRSVDTPGCQWQPVVMTLPSV